MASAESATQCFLGCTVHVLQSTTFMTKRLKRSKETEEESNLRLRPSFPLEPVPWCSCASSIGLFRHLWADSLNVSFRAEVAAGMRWPIPR